MDYTLIEDIAREIRVPEKGILSHTVHNDDAVKIIVFGFAAGQELSAHTAPMPATIQILEGEADVLLGANSRSVRSGCLIHMQPSLPHSIIAKTPVLMLLILVKAARSV